MERECMALFTVIGLCQNILFNFGKNNDGSNEVHNLLVDCEVLK